MASGARECAAWDRGHSPVGTSRAPRRPRRRWPSPPPGPARRPTVTTHSSGRALSAGGSTDILARALGQKLTEVWGQQVIVDNPGRGGSIGAEAVARAPADGYTLLMAHIGTLAVNPALYPKLGYDPAKDFAPVSMVAIVPNVLVVHPSVPAKTVTELIDYAGRIPAS